MAEVQRTSQRRVQDMLAEVNSGQITKGLNPIVRSLQTQQEASECFSAEE